MGKDYGRCEGCLRPEAAAGPLKVHLPRFRLLCRFCRESVDRSDRARLAAAAEAEVARLQAPLTAEELDEAAGIVRAAAGGADLSFLSGDACRRLAGRLEYHAALRRASESVRGSD